MPLFIGFWWLAGMLAKAAMAAKAMGAAGGAAKAAMGSALGGAVKGAAQGAQGAQGATAAPAAAKQVSMPQMNPQQTAALGADRTAASGLQGLGGSPQHNRVGGVQTQPMAVAAKAAPSQAAGFAKELGKGYLDNYMASQGIDMDNPPSSFGEGLKQVAQNRTGYNPAYNTGGAGGLMKGLLKGYAEKWANMTPAERKQGTVVSTGPAYQDPNAGRLSDFVGTIQTQAERAKKRLPY